MAEQSLTITGLLMMAVMFLFSQAGVKITNIELGTFIKVASGFGTVIGWVIAYIGRMRKGDVGLLGGKK